MMSHCPRGSIAPHRSGNGLRECRGSAELYAKGCPQDPPVEDSHKGASDGTRLSGGSRDPDELRFLVTNDAMTDREDGMRTVPRGPIVAHVLTEFAGTS